MGTSITNNEKLTLFILAFLVYSCANFLEASRYFLCQSTCAQSECLASFKFDENFMSYIPLFLAYLTIDLLGGDVIHFVKTLFRYKNA